MDLQLNGKTALVTGSTAGIGFAIAASLAQEGAAVVVNGRTEAGVAKALQELSNARISGFAGDLGTAEAAERLFRQVPAVDILVNNLGIFEPKAFEDIPDADWVRFFEVNVLSGVRLSRLYVPEMKKRNWGRIIFISSESGVQIPTEMIHYGMTKTAQITVARGLAQHLKGTGITVNSVLAGPTSSRGVGDFIEQLPKKQGTSREQMEKEFLRQKRQRNFYNKKKCATFGALLETQTQTLLLKGKGAPFSRALPLH